MFEQNDFHLGDKLRLKSGEHASERGTFIRYELDKLIIRLPNAEEVSASVEQVTNFSLAARRAWQKMPKRSGRPKSTTNKRMVSIRIGSASWERLGQAAELGLIVSRESAINLWVEQHLDALLKSSSEVE